MGEFDADAEDEVVLPDGTVMVRTWHGAKVHPVTGVRGGLMDYRPDVAPMAAESTGDPVATVAAGVIVVCPICHTPQLLPAWLARRFRTCSRRCAMLARHNGG